MLVEGLDPVDWSENDGRKRRGRKKASPSEPRPEKHRKRTGLPPPGPNEKNQSERSPNGHRLTRTSRASQRPGANGRKTSVPVRRRRRFWMTRLRRLPSPHDHRSGHLGPARAEGTRAGGMRTGGTKARGSSHGGNVIAGTTTWDPRLSVSVTICQHLCCFGPVARGRRRRRRPRTQRPEPPHERAPGCLTTTETRL